MCEVNGGSLSSYIQESAVSGVASTYTSSGFNFVKRLKPSHAKIGKWTMRTKDLAE